MIYIAPKIISYRFVSDKSIAHRLIYQPTDGPNLLQRWQTIFQAEVNYFHVYAPFYDSIKSTQVLKTFITLFSQSQIANYVPLSGRQGVPGSTILPVWGFWGILYSGVYMTQTDQNPSRKLVLQFVPGGFTPLTGLFCNGIT